jgi:hypothetical protein
MSPKKAIEILTRLVAEAQELHDLPWDSPKRDQWTNTARGLLERAFRFSSSILQNFDRAQSIVFNKDATDEEMQHKVNSVLASTVAVLRSAMEQLGWRTGDELESPKHTVADTGGHPTAPSASSGSLALNILQQAIKAVPAVKYALGIAGVVATIAIIQLLRVDFVVAAVGSVIMLLLMTVLVVFAKATARGAVDFRYPLQALVWFSLILLMAVAIALFTSVFWNQPVPLQSWLRQATPTPTPMPPEKPSAVRYNFYREYLGNQPTTFCLGEKIPKSTPVEVSVAGSWTEVPSGRFFNGPLAGAKVFVVSAVTGVERPDQPRKPYQHPLSFTPSFDFDVCVQLTNPETLNNRIQVNSTDVLKISVNELLLPAQPPPALTHHFQSQCREKMDDFKMVAASTTPTQGVKTYYCRGMEPGKSVDADVNGSFHIDNPGPGGGWVTMEAILDGGSGVNGGHCFGTEFDEGRRCNMGGDSNQKFSINWHLSGQVGPDGVATLKIHVSRAYDQLVHQHSLSADDATVTFTSR